MTPTPDNMSEARAAAEEEIDRWGANGDCGSVARSAVEAALAVLSARTSTAPVASGLARRMAEVAQRALYHDIDESMPEYKSGVETLTRLFTPMLKGRRASPPPPQPGVRVTRWSMEKLTGSVTLTPCVRDDGEWVKFADVVDICAANQRLRREARSPTGGREAGLEAGVTMQAVVRVDEFNGQTLWECTERDGRGEVSTHETVELAASTFPIGTKLLISEPTR